MTLQEVINFTPVILKQSPQEKNKSLPVITVYVVYSLVSWCFNYTYHVCLCHKGVFSSLCGLDGAPQGSVCFAAHMVTESNDRMDVLNKPVIVRWAYAGMSHGSVVEHLLLPDEFPSCCFTNGGSTSSSPLILASPSTTAELNIHGKKEGDETEREPGRRAPGAHGAKMSGGRRER